MNIISKMHYSFNIITWISIILCITLPIFTESALNNLLPMSKFDHYPLHSILEGIGAFSALTISVLILVMLKYNYISEKYALIANALTAMGVLDGFHSILYAGNTFVWLHSIATLLGGVLFSLIWIPINWSDKKIIRFSIIITTIFALLVGILSIIFNNAIPVMVSNSQFTFIAKLMNITGGIGFLISAGYFIYKATIIEQNRANVEIKIKNIVFANHCILFSIAGLLFENSVLWDASWWLWHFLRIFAYLVVLIYFFTLFQKSQNLLKLHEIELESVNKTLELRVLERTQEIQMIQDELIKKNRLATLGQLTATVSHELRNPLGAMRPSVHVLRKLYDQSDTRVGQALERIDRSIDRCDRIIDELLDYTRITNLNLKKTNLNEWLDNLINETILCESIMIRKHLDINIPLILFDSDRLQRAVINIIDNACHAMKDESLLITKKNAILEVATEEKDDRVNITISDTGCGIQDEILPKIFEPLFSTKGFGVGLGMPTVKQIMEQHRGGVELQTKIGLGTKVTLWLPIVKVE